MKSISSKSIAFITILIISIVTFLTIANNVTLKRNLTESYHNEGTLIAASLSDALFNDIYNFNINNIRTQLETIRLNSIIQSIYILDSEGIVLSDGTEENVFRNRKLPDTFVNTIITTKSVQKKLTEDNFKLSHPVGIEGLEPIGYIYINFSFEKVRTQLQKSIKTNIVIAAVILLIASIISFIFTSHLTKPLSELKSIAENITQDKFNKYKKYNIPNYGDNEIGSLSTALQHMLAKIISSHDELIQLNNTLESRINERTKQLKEEKDRAEHATQAKSIFLSNMSHELRTPLNGVMGMIELLLKTDLDKKQKEYSDIALSSGNILLDLINNILDLSKIEAEKMQLENINFNLRNKINDIVNIFMLTANRNGIELITEIDNNIPEFIYADTTRLGQVLINLIGNAIKFTERGEVKIKINLLEPDNSTQLFQFDISDTGAGIDKADIEMIFSSFSQADLSTTRKYGGTGLGLTISRQIVNLMGGELTASSVKNQGSTFSFSIPAVFSEKTTLQETKPPAQTKEIQTPLQGLNILIAEDNMVNQLVIEALLKNLGATTSISDNGQKAFDEVMHNDFDLVLMDCQMPVMDGYEATKKIREIESDNKNKIPIIALTANVMTHDIEKCLQSGMNAHIAKPVSQDIVIETILNALSADSK